MSPKWHTAREHVIGKSEILIILSCERVFIAVENWMARCSRTNGLISPAKRFLQMLCFVFMLNIFVENEWTNAE